MKFFLHIGFAFLISLPIVLSSQAQSNTKDTSNTFTKNFLFLPIVIKSPETKLGIGYASSYFFKYRKDDTITRTSNIESIGLYTMRKQVVLMLGMNLFTPDEKYIFRVRNTFSKFPDKYWGIGDETPKDAEEKYAYTQFFTNPQLMRKIYSKFYVGITSELQIVYDMKFIDNKLFDNTVVLGKSGGVSSGLGLVSAWDTRNNAFSPDKGTFVQVSLIRFSKIIFSEFDFWNTVIDARKFVSFGKKRKNILALQFFGNFTSGQVPFRYLSQMGGTDVMRGYYAGRYRDKNIIAIQAEYRFPVVWRLGMVLFGSIGEVSDKIDKYRFRKIKYGIGSGLRFALKPKEKLNLRIDFGWGNQSFATYLTVTEAF